jgi:hypothetical protein
MQMPKNLDELKKFMAEKMESNSKNYINKSFGFNKVIL